MYYKICNTPLINDYIKGLSEKACGLYLAQPGIATNFSAKSEI